jgi:regulator of CtrA degradation
MAAIRRIDMDGSAGRRETAFFSKTYDETLALLDESQAYLRACHPVGDLLADPRDILIVRTEAFRLSSRLMQSTAWLLARRAVHNGELDPETVRSDPQYRLGAREVCRDDTMHCHPAISEELCDLLERSLSLYIRIERLDELHRRIVH